MNQENKINLFEIIKSSPTLASNTNDEFYISINSNGESNVIINGIKYKINDDKIKSILDGISKNYIVFKTMSENQNGEGILGGESYIMTLSSDSEKIQINNTLLSIENQKNFDGFVDLLIEEIKTQNKGSDDNMNDEKLKKIVEEVIGNNDPFWNKPVFEVVKKIIEMPNETESSISKLLGTSQYSSKQLFDIYHCVNKVCKRINIVLDFSKENAKVDGLLYNLPFTKRIANKNFICPNCSEPLTFIKFGTILYCKKCNKNYERNNDSVGNEISSIWSNENKSEISNNNVNEIVLKIVDSIKTLPDNIETTIAQLLQLSNEEVALVDPLTQGTIFNLIKEQCKTLKIRIEVNRDEIGGLAYRYKFKKETMDAYIQPNKANCKFCGAPTIIVSVKDSNGGHDALVCSKCNKFQNETIINQSVDELIKKVSGPDPFWQNSIKKYFDNLDKTDEEKIIFLQNISLDKQVFNDFTKEINSVSNPNDIFDKYKEKIMNNNRFMTNKGEFKQINDDELKNKKVETYAEWED